MLIQYFLPPFWVGSAKIYFDNPYMQVDSAISNSRQTKLLLSRTGLELKSQFHVSCIFTYNSLGPIASFGDNYCGQLGPTAPFGDNKVCQDTAILPWSPFAHNRK